MSDLPSGKVTFLFTDIEGSTRLWEDHPETMRGALARHNEILNQVIVEHQGRVFKTVGDSFCAVFLSGVEASAAAVETQRRFQCEVWPAVATLRVRVALHTGYAEPEGRDYFGPLLNRVSRILSAANGGQILVSEATEGVIRDRLSESVSLISCGSHRLKDLGEPEVLFQLCHPEIRVDFPPLHSLAGVPHNLPQQLSSFIGREREVSEVEAALSGSRLLTLTGSGGCGKTRLALQVAAEMVERYPDGVWLTELASVADGALLPQVAAQVFGLREDPGRPLILTLAGLLRERTLLWILDNTEHLIEACAHLVATILRDCPRVTILATSREPLSVAGESTYRVPSLACPGPADDFDLDALSRFESVRLFADRAGAVNRSFAITSSNSRAVATVCRRLDGIPLAIELAAARVRSMPVEEITLRLDQRFRLLTSGRRDAMPRQQTLRSLIDWSYDLLTEREKRLLERLSVFAGGWTLSAAESVCCGSDLDDWEIVDLLGSLVDKSLVVYQGEEERYRLLETVRQYAGERLVERSEQEQTRLAHLDFFKEFAEEAGAYLTGPDQQASLDRIETEHDNIRAALGWNLHGHRSPDQGLRICASLYRFWDGRGYWSEGRRWCAEVLAAVSEAAPPLVRSAVVHVAGMLAYRQGDNTSAQELFQESLEIGQALDDRNAVAKALLGLGNVEQDLGDLAAAQAFFERSLAIRREAGDRAGVAAALNNLGTLVKALGNYSAARAYHNECLAISREIGDRRQIAYSVGNLARTEADSGDFEMAGRQFQQALALAGDLCDQWGVAIALNGLAETAHARGDPDTARTRYNESLKIARELGDRWGVGVSLHGLGHLALDEHDYEAAQSVFGESLRLRQQIADRPRMASSLESIAALKALSEPEAAAKLWGAAERIREETSEPRPHAEESRYQRSVETIRANLADGAAFEGAWQQGRDLPEDQAIELALAVCQPPVVAA